MFGKGIIRITLLSVAAAVMAVGASAMPGGQAHADGGFRDITGKPIQLQVGRQDPLSGAITPEASPLTGAAQQILSTPLSVQFDQLWSGTAAPTICKQLTSNLQGAGSGGFHLYNVTCSLAKTGKLSAEQQGDSVLLSYYLPNNVIETSVTTPGTCDPDHFSILCPDDPRVSLTLDIELQASIHAPGPACQLQADPNASVLFHNANLDSQNLTADIAKDAASLLADVTGTDFLSMAENYVDQTVYNQQLPMASQIASFTNALCSGLLSKTGDAWQLTASVDPTNGIVFHLLDMPPVPSLFHATLTASQPVVTAGNSLGLSGQYFPTGGGSVTLTMDAAGPSPSTNSPSLSSRLNEDYLPVLLGSQAADDSTAQSNSSPFSTSRLHTSDLALLAAARTTLGTASLTSQGAFSTTVTIPAGTAAGAHTIHATANGTEADATIQVAAPSTNGISATITMVTSLGTATSSMATGAPPFTLAGNGFAPGTVTITLDSATGTQLGTATAAADGTFRVQLEVPNSDAGKHTLVAVENETVQAQQAVTFVLPEVIH